MSTTSGTTLGQPPSSKPPSPSSTPSMLAQDQGTARRAPPSQVQTYLFLRQGFATVPPSAISSSSMASGSVQESPSLYADVVPRTASSSINASPDLLDTRQRGRALSDNVPPLNLLDSFSQTRPDATVSRKTSTTSLGQGALVSPGHAGGDQTKAGLVRRTSNSVRKAAGSLIRRRPSSTQPKSRDGSVGPGVYRIRQRSNSGPGNPPEATPVATATFTDSDEDLFEEREDLASLCDGASREFSSPPMSTTASSAGSISTFNLAVTTGPVIPVALRQGMPMNKVSKSKKNKLKRINLVLDPDNAKIWWDRNRSSKTVYLDDIKEIRTSPDIRQYLLDSGVEESHEPRFFTIIYSSPDKPGHKVLHLVADNDAGFRSWTEALEAISKHRQDFAISLMSFNDKAVRQYWQREMTKQRGGLPASGEETIDFPGVERVCRNLHIHVSSQALKEKFKAVTDSIPSKTPDRLDFSGFLEFVRLMKTRKDMEPIYQCNALSDRRSGLSWDEFLHFIRETQHENVDDVAYWEEVFTRFARKGKAKDTTNNTNGGETLRISESSFGSFLTSTLNSLIPKEPASYVLDRPMNEYYISSSHNTYLLGRQVAGVSSNEGYILALMRGCRCVEVDCWDGQDDQPVVVHGRTMTTQISFLEVIKTINKYAFVKSHFPLWISLEVRCSWATQANMAKIMLEVFGDKLLLAPLPHKPDELPAPSELMDRILIKVKKSTPLPAEDVAKSDIFRRRRSNSHPSPYARAVDGTPVPGSPLLSPTPATRSNRQIETINEYEVHDAPSSSPSECESESERESVKKSSKINPLLGDLGVYGMGIPFDGFETPDAKTFNHIFSFKEKTFSERNQPGEPKRTLYRHNMRHMIRVYPNASRISSSNFDPLVYWKRGVQMAALNWQTFDFGMQINQAMFDSGTDASGYVLKPLEAREILVKPNDPATEGKRRRKNISFKIDVISAQQLMRPYNLGERRTLDPYVEVEVFLADDVRNKADAASNNAAFHTTALKYRTKIVRENGFNPFFNGSHTFNVTTKYPDLIFVRWSVRIADSRGYNDKPPMATFTAKLSSLKQGYRTLPLLDHNGDRYLFSTLFCRLETDSTDIMVPYDEASESSNKFKIGRSVFRSNASPKSSMDSGMS